MGTFDPARIYNTGIMMMNWDNAVFGTYLPFWLQGQSWSHIVDVASLEAYLQLTTMTTLVTLGLIVIGKVRHFRQFIMSFFLSFILATPIWFTFPTVTPNELFRENVFAAPTDTPMAQYAVAQSQLIGPMTTELLFNVSHMQSNPAVNHYHVPTFPSMHVAWGIVLVYFAFIIAWPVGVLYILWWILNITGAVFSLQHFGVDVIAGTIIGSLAFLVSGYLLRFEDRFLAVPKTTFRTLRYVSEDIAHFTHIVMKKLAKLKT
jgi:membrane-associated phospholipid phosphatase